MKHTLLNDCTQLQCHINECKLKMLSQGLTKEDRTLTKLLMERSEAKLEGLLNSLSE